MLVELPDPFIPGNVFHVDPGRVVLKCKAIFERHQKDHARCVHCPALRALVGRLGETVYPALAFEAWAEPRRGLTDTQPVKIQPETGFAVVEEEEPDERD